MPTVGNRAPKRGTGVRVRTKRTSRIDREYMITPNALLRGEGVYSVLSSYARLLLAAGLSCGDHEPTLEEIDGWIPELGRNRGQAVRRELRQHGFLRLRQSMRPDDRTEVGTFVWTYEFLADQLPVAECDELRPKKPTTAGSLGSFVYYVRRSDDLIKIGMSKHLDIRLENLEELFGPLELLGVEPGARTIEAQRHRQFSSHHVSDLPKWQGNEWFREHKALADHIAALGGGR